MKLIISFDLLSAPRAQLISLSLRSLYSRQLIAYLQCISLKNLSYMLSLSLAHLSETRTRTSDGITAQNAVHNAS